MLCGAHSQARLFVRAIIPPLLAWYPDARTISVGEPPKPATEAMLMIFPRRWLIMTLAAAWAHRNAPVKLVSRTLFQPSRGISSAGAPQDAPALLIRMSIRPN